MKYKTSLTDECAEFLAETLQTHFRKSKNDISYLESF